MQVAGARTRRRCRRVGVALVAATLLGGCTVGPSRQPELITSSTGSPQRSSAEPSDAPSSMPLGPGGPGRAAAPVSWGDCPATQQRADPVSKRQFQLDCSTVDVPATDNGSSSAVLGLAISRARVAALPTTAPVLLVLRGEPGEAGAQDVAAVAGSLPVEITARFAVLVVDLRGTADSGAIACVSDGTAASLLAPASDPASTAGAALVAQTTRTLTYDCGDEAGPGLTSFSTVSATDDLDTVRAALGVDTWTVLGQGFGATLGAVYADRYPGRVSAAVLDAPTDPNLPAEQVALARAAAQEQALNALASACAGFSGGCPLGTDPRAAVAATVSALNSTPLVAAAGGTVNGGTVLLGLALALDEPDGWPTLATAIAAARGGDGSTLFTLVSTALGGDQVESQLAARVLFTCNDSATRLIGAPLTTAAKAAGTTAPLFGAFDLGQVGLCGGWPTPDRVPGPVAATGAAPILIVGAVNDPVTPFSAVQSLSGRMRSATLLSVASTRHRSYPGNACVSGLVDLYLLQHSVPQLGTLCPA